MVNQVSLANKGLGRQLRQRPRRTLLKRLGEAEAPARAVTEMARAAAWC
jgi:hypothetical protein